MTLATTSNRRSAIQVQKAKVIPSILLQSPQFAN
uniref:Uncharacterized protein n=1 Tax=Anguilla anguilla TaxID=7936 RepID=A0A0E9SWU6_ANGAN